MSKKSRLEAIIEIVENCEIDTQEELTEKLNEKGFDASQATVSRDIKELNLVKIKGNEKKFRYAVPKKVSEGIPEGIINLFKQITQSVIVVNNMIIIKTLSGNASSAGMTIDKMHFSEVIGTIAGDDTLLIITKTDKDAETVSKNLRTL